MTDPTHLQYVCFTVNNWTDNDVKRLKALDTAKFRYCEAAHEVGSSGTPHLQGYLELIRQMRFTAVKKLMPHGTHLERRRGTQQRALDYIRKGQQSHEEWEELGTLGPSYGHLLQTIVQVGVPFESTQGRRSDLTTLTDAISDGMPLKLLAEQFPEMLLKFGKNIQFLYRLRSMPFDSSECKRVIVYYGETGTGKTRRALCQDPEAYLHGPENKTWFDGYDPLEHHTVILDEFRANLSFGFMLRLLDRYPMKVEYKGGMTEFSSKTIIITSPVHPAQWYPNLSSQDGKMAQLRRRITYIYKCETLDEPPLDVTTLPWSDFQSTEEFSQFHNDIWE